jgi:hypothetical protein
MHGFWAAVTIAVVVAIVVVVAWTFLVAPLVVPGRRSRQR